MRSSHLAALLLAKSGKVFPLALGVSALIRSGWQ